MAASHKEAIRLVQRARIIALMYEDPTLYDSEAALQAGFRSATVGAQWVKRFNELGVAGLEDKPRPGRRPDHSRETRSALVSLALQKPATLGYPFQL